MSYTILYSGEPEICTLDIITVSGALQNPSAGLGASTVVVGLIGVAVALPNPVVAFGSATVTLDVITIQGSFENPVAAFGSATCTLGELGVGTSLPDPVVSLSLTTATVGFITAVVALQDLDVRHMQTVVPDAITIQASLENPTVICGALTSTADILSIISTLSDPIVVISGGITAVVDKITIQMTLLDLFVPCFLDPIVVQATLLSPTSIPSGMITVQLDPANVGVSLSNLTVIKGLSTIILDNLGIVITPLSQTFLNVPHVIPYAPIITDNNTWGGIFLARPDPDTSTDRALIVSFGFTVMNERQEAGETHIYVWGTTTQVYNWTKVRVGLRADLPYFFFRLPAGVPLTVDLVLRGAPYPGELLKF